MYDICSHDLLDKAWDLAYLKLRFSWPYGVWIYSESFRESLNVPLGVHLTTALGFVYTFLNCIKRIFCVYIFLPSLVIYFAPSLVIIVIIWLDAFAYAFCQNILTLLLFSLAPLLCFLFLIYLYADFLFIYLVAVK